MKEKLPNEKKINKKILIFIFAVLLLLVLVALVCILENKKEKVLSNSKKENSGEVKNEEGNEEEEIEKWQEGIISYNGKEYLYNTNIKSYLFMGIDDDEPVEIMEGSSQGGQSDALFLLVVDSEKEEISVVSIHRNTMTRIETFYDNGISSGYEEAQICVQHGFGDGRHLSCVRTVDAVSHLFYNLPISGYLSLNMGGIPTLNDAVGGVEITALEDLEMGDVHIDKGDQFTLDGDQAYVYLRARDIEVFDSATGRLRRQEQYIEGYQKKLKSTVGDDVEKVMDIYDSMSDYMVSSIDFADLAEQLIDYKYTNEQMHTVPGETVMGEKFEEYYVDEEAFYDLIIQLFYKEVSE